MSIRSEETIGLKKPPLAVDCNPFGLIVRYFFLAQWELEIRFEGAIIADPRHAYARCVASAQRHLCYATALGCTACFHFNS